MHPSRETASWTLEQSTVPQLCAVNPNCFPLDSNGLMDWGVQRFLRFVGFPRSTLCQSWNANFTGDLQLDHPHSNMPPKPTPNQASPQTPPTPNSCGPPQEPRTTAQASSELVAAPSELRGRHPRGRDAVAVRGPVRCSGLVLEWFCIFLEGEARMRCAGQC